MELLPIFGSLLEAQPVSGRTRSCGRLRRGVQTLATVALVLGAWQGLRAQVHPGGNSPLAARSFRHPGLFIAGRYRPVEQLPAPARQAATASLAALGVPPGRAFVDLRSGRWGSASRRPISGLKA